MNGCTRHASFTHYSCCQWSKANAPAPAGAAGSAAAAGSGAEAGLAEVVVSEAAGLGAGEDSEERNSHER